MDHAMINTHTWVFLFLQAFLDRIGDKLYKQGKFDIADSSTTTNVWNTVKKKALKLCTKDNSQISNLWKAKKIEDHSGQLNKAEKARPAKIETTTDPIRLLQEGKTEELDSVT